MNYNSPVYQINATNKTKHLRVTGSRKRQPPMNKDLNGSQNKGRENTFQTVAVNASCSSLVSNVNAASGFRLSSS